MKNMNHRLLFAPCCYSSRWGRGQFGYVPLDVAGLKEIFANGANLPEVFALVNEVESGIDLK
jgi:hypothetical protein